MDMIKMIIACAVSAQVSEARGQDTKADNKIDEVPSNLVQGKHVSLNFPIIPPIISAAENGKEDKVTKNGETVENGKEDKVTKKGDLIKAAEKGDVHSVRALLAEGYYQNNHIFTRENAEALLTGLFNAYLVLSNLILALPPNYELFELPYNADQEKREALKNAVIKGHAEVVLSLVEDGVDINYRESLYTPLSEAASRGNKEMVSVLLELGAKPNSKNFDGSTALHLAAQKGHVGVVRALVIEGAIVNKVDNSGKTALHFAKQKGHVDVVRGLLEAGANALQADKAGKPVSKKERVSQDFRDDTEI